jgi:uncharacterized membrane protein
MFVNIIERLTFYIGLFGYIVIYWGIVKSLYQFFQAELYKKQNVQSKSLDQIRLMLGKYLSFGLEIFIGKDIVTTILSPTWQEIERLGAIVAIRIVLNFFLNRDIKLLTSKEQ